MKSKWTQALAFAVALSSSAIAGAHGIAIPKHGGLVDNGGEITFELVTSKNRITIFVDDHGKPVSTQGASAELLAGSRTGKRIATLSPSGLNAVSGTKPVFRSGDRLYVRLTMHDGSISIGEFIVK